MFADFARQFAAEMALAMSQLIFLHDEEGLAIKVVDGGQLREPQMLADSLGFLAAPVRGKSGGME